jgi:ubiquinone/menaquinone biosynthesis C-methylase UbiE
MADVFDKKKIRKVYHDVRKHQLIEQLIRRFSTNKDDIRKTALTQACVAGCRRVLELGCAFGSFTESLQGMLHPDARICGLDIIPEYKPFFLEACRRAGYRGNFSAAGISQIRKYPDQSFDLIICSFALYFFADMIPQIARILTKDGKFIAITHYQSNMQELIFVTKNILRRNNLLADDELLPIEIITSRFSAENGRELLAHNFHKVISIDFENRLIFQPQEIMLFIEYFRFKSPFFLIGTNTDPEMIAGELVSELERIASTEKEINMCKDDGIFICTEPYTAKEQM